MTALGALLSPARQVTVRYAPDYVRMDFMHSPRAREMLAMLQRAMEDLVLPSLAEYHKYADAGVHPLDVLEPLKASAKAMHLWNLFLPSLRSDQPGTPLSNTDYAPLAEAMGRVPWASEVFNCSAPDSGNIELLQLFASPAQRQAWLDPLLQGDIRSCFAMSEPDVASSDPTQLQTRVRSEGDSLVLTGRKWFITGAAHPLCRVALVVARDDDVDVGGRHGSHSIVLVPMEAAGVHVERNIPVMDHVALEGHCEIVFREVRVPAENRLGAPGEGFRMAQARLGPGRVHHAMRSIGQCELALELMCERARERYAFGHQLAAFANIQEWIAHSRLEIDQARLLVLRAAWRLDSEGAAAAKVDASAIKVVTAQLQTRILDRAMQVFGAMGLSPDTPLARMWSWGRALRFLDGPDEVHLRTVAREQLSRVRTQTGVNALHFRRRRP
jgi:acyl-CoA dehydrogenase